MNLKTLQDIPPWGGRKAPVRCSWGFFAMKKLMNPSACSMMMMKSSTNAVAWSRDIEDGREEKKAEPEDAGLD